ncbi:MAG: hypothetical protein EAX87_02545 [Candidatus Thorarchaeota archaeon]|nr:hypothetical protein [Candidatus Thorarchaeota archaeon]
MLQIPFFDWTLEEIMAFFKDPWILAWVLILSGGLLAVWLLENITDPIPVLGTIFDGLVAVGTYIGFFVGILDIFVGYVVWTTQPDAIIVSGVLVLMGFSLVMRILSKFPLALIFALAVAVFGAATVYGFVQPLTNNATLMSVGTIASVINFIISGKGLLIIGFVIFCVAYVLGGLIIKLIELIGKIFASRPVSVLVGLAAIAVGVVVILNPSLVGLIVPWPV